MLKIQWWRQLLSFLLIAGCCLPAAPVLAQTELVVIRISPASVQVDPGETVDVVVEVVDTPPAYGFEFRLRYNPFFIEVVDLDPYTPGVQIALGEFFDPGFVVANQADVGTGEIYISMSQISPMTEKSGSGTLAIIRLRGRFVTPGATPLDLATALLLQRDSTSLPTNLLDGAVTVGSGDGKLLLLPLIVR